MAKRAIRRTTENEILNLEFLTKMEEVKKQKSIRVENFAKRYGIDI